MADAPLDAVIPDRRHARRLVVSVAIFWALWGMLFVGTLNGAPGGLLAPAFVVAISSCLYFYLIFFDVWRDTLGAPTWRVLLVPSFRRATTTRKLMRNLYRPRWLWATLRATEWSPWALASGLLALLATDLVIFGAFSVRAMMR